MSENSFANCFRNGSLALLLLALLLSSTNSFSQQKPKTVHVAAAADLMPLLPGIAAQYEKTTGTHLEISFASSSTLAMQIINGAPIDLFLAANASFPEKVVAAHLADTTAPIPYAQGALVLWARKDSPLQPISLDTLKSPALKTLAVANPDHAPYGRAAISALTSMKLLDALRPRFVMAENIAQTAQFVESGNAQAGLISLTAASTAHFRSLGSYVLVPKKDYPALRQCAVVMRNSANRTAAHAFLNYLLSPEVQLQMAKQGLQPAK
ncbi:MAG: molybdate ABC transporter substrate-binding protein [Acidobacteriaceae bacterium]